MEDGTGSRRNFIVKAVTTAAGIIAVPILLERGADAGPSQLQRHTLELESVATGGDTVLTFAASGDTQFTTDENGALSFRGPGEVKVRELIFTPYKITIRRNPGDGTAFTLVFGIETPRSEISFQLDNSQGTGGYIDLRRPGIDSIRLETHTPNSVSITRNMALRH